VAGALDEHGPGASYRRRPARQWTERAVRSITLRSPTMDSYLLLLHEDPSQYTALSPSEMQAIIEQYRRWSQKLAAAGRLVDGHKLADEGGRRVRVGHGGPLGTDGPFAESKDVIGGLFVIKAESNDEAVRLASDCPHLRGGNEIELRRIEAT
jgi:hypothetical protein